MRIEAGFAMRWWFSRYTEDWKRIAAEPKSRAVAIPNRHFPDRNLPRDRYPTTAAAGAPR